MNTIKAHLKLIFKKASVFFKINRFLRYVRFLLFAFNDFTAALGRTVSCYFFFTKGVMN